MTHGIQHACFFFSFSKSRTLNKCTGWQFMRKYHVPCGNLWTVEICLTCYALWVCRVGFTSSKYFSHNTLLTKRNKQKYIWLWISYCKKIDTFFLPSASKGWGRYCFHRCLSVHTPRRVPQSQVLSHASGPKSFLGQGTPVLSWPGVTPVPAGGGVPQGRGTPPPARTGLGYPSLWDRTAERALATRRTVRLLRSRNRTFLFKF